MCLLTISVKNTRPEVVKLAKIAQNSGFSRLELVRARTFERKVIETWCLHQFQNKFFLLMIAQSIEKQILSKTPYHFRTICLSSKTGLLNGKWNLVLKMQNSLLLKLSPATVFRPNPKGWGPIGLGCPSVRPSVCPSYFFVRARTFERKVIETWL